MDEKVRRVADCMLAMDLERDFWQKAVGLTWMIRNGGAAYLGHARAMVERTIATQTSQGHLNYNDRLFREHGHIRVFTSTNGPASLGFPLLCLYERDPQPRYLEAAHRQYEAVVSGPRTSDGGLSARLEACELWIDTLSICSFLMRYGRVSGKVDAVTEAWQQIAVHVEHLVDPRTGLSRHAWTEIPDSYGQSAFWSRGHGWLACALVDAIAEDPAGEPAGRAAATLNRLVTALIRYQDRSGFWRNILDDPFERLEASGTLMHAYAIGRGVQLGIVDELNLPAALRAFEAVDAAIGPDGSVIGVAVPPGGPGVPLGVTPFGQGFYLRARQVLTELTDNEVPTTNAPRR